MALTVSSVQTVANTGFYTLTEATFDSKYLEGGEAFTPANAGLASFTHTPVCFVVNGSEDATLRPTNAYYSGEKLHLIDSATGKEVVAAKDCSKVKVLVLAFGKTRSK